MEGVSELGVRKIAVFYGHVASNLGDLAINAGELEVLKRVYPEATVKFVALHVDEGPAFEQARSETARVGDADWSIFRTSFRHVLEYLSQPTYFLEQCGVEDCDLMVLASGEHLFAYEDNPNLRSLYWRTLPAIAGKTAGKQVLLFPSTFGPYETDESRKLIESILELVDGLAAREQRSADLLEKEFGTCPIVLPDPAFFLEPNQKRSIGKTSKNVLGLVMRAEDWGIRLSRAQRVDAHDSEDEGLSGKKGLAFSAAVIEHFLSVHPQGEVRIFVQTSADANLAESLLEKFDKVGLVSKILVTRPGSISEYLDELAKLDLLIASRFHAQIMALITQVPVYGVYFPTHGHKVPGLFSWLGIPSFCCPIEADTELTAQSAVNQLINEPFDWGLLNKKLGDGRKDFTDWLASVHMQGKSEANLLRATFALNALSSELVKYGYQQQSDNAQKKLESKLESRLRSEFEDEIKKLKHQPADDFKNMVNNLQIENADLAQCNGELHKRNEQLQRDSVQLRGQLSNIRGSSSYQLAAEVARTLRSRHRMLSLPLRLYGVFRETREAKNSRKHILSVGDKRQHPVSDALSNDPKNKASVLVSESKALSEKGLYKDALELSSRALALYRSEATLRSMFWAQQNAGDVESAYKTILELQAFIGKHPNITQKQRMEFLCSQPSFQLNLKEKLPAKKTSLGYEPVKGRIAYILHNSLPFSSGGYATRAQGLARGLTAQKYEVIAFTRPGYPVDIDKQLKAADIAGVEDIDGVTYVRTLEPSRKNLKMKDFVPVAKDAYITHFKKYKPEVVVAASNYICALPALFAARELGLPFVYEVRGFWEITRLSREPGFIEHPSYNIQELMEAHVCNEADHVLTLTNAMKAELARRGVDDAKIDIVPNACEPERFLPRGKDAGLANQLNIPENVPVIGYIGTFVDYEGLEDLAKAGGLLKEKGQKFRLLLVGNENVSGTDRGPISQAVLDAADRYQFRDWLIMPGRVPHEQVSTYYSLIDIAPFPRKPWPVCEMVSPMKPMEAMAMEKAVVVSSVSALAEMVGQGEFGVIFEKGSDKALADALSNVIADPELRTRLGKEGRKHVLAERTWRRSSERFAHALVPLFTDN